MTFSRSYPSETVIEDQVYRYEKILKNDLFSVNVLYKNEHGERYVLKLSDFRYIWGILFRPIAALISQHEYKIYTMVADIPGIPTLGPRYGWRGYFHKFIEGKTLQEVKKEDVLPTDFFDQLNRTVRELHARRIFYMDLDKLGNVIVSDEGQCFLIDFQICIYFKPRKGWLGSWLDRAFHRLIKEDIYHIYKRKKAYQPELMTEQEYLLAQRSQLSQSFAKYFWRPYLSIKRIVFPHGSNETLWYKWKAIKDKETHIH